VFGNDESNAPVVAGETYDVSIEDVAKKGDGIARIEGFVIFVPESKVGDKIKIKVNKVMRKFAIAEKVE
jgi:predicted RNA-binding protein with TRAM domain